MSILKDTRVTWAITAIVIIIGLVAYYLTIPEAKFVSNTLQTWVISLTFFTILVGAIVLLRIQINNVRKRVPGTWYFSIWMMIIFFTMIITGLMNFPQVGSSQIFSDIYNTLNKPVTGAIYSLLAFYIAGSAYRTFRAKNRDSTIFLLSTMLVMLFAVPWGGLLWSGFPVIGEWIMMIPNAAVQRAISITMTVGLLAMVVRIILGKEKGVTG